MYHSLETWTKLDGIVQAAAGKATSSPSTWPVGRPTLTSACDSALDRSRQDPPSRELELYIRASFATRSPWYRPTLSADSRDTADTYLLRVP